MRLSLILILPILIAGFVTVSASIINVPDDYSTIQEGINASSDGDTVLVQPDTYVENINFSGHNIVLGSLFLTTGDTSYIEQTVIDGNQSGSVVTLRSDEDSTAVITGFTLQNGYALLGGGIHLSESNPTIIHNIISENGASGYPAKGGGIYCYGSNPIVSQNLITQNRADWLGGGIFSDSSNINIVNNNIYNNSAQFAGGGIFCSKQSPVIKSNIIINNIVAETQNGYGGGIACSYDESILIQNNIIANNI